MATPKKPAAPKKPRTPKSTPKKSPTTTKAKAKSAKTTRVQNSKSTAKTRQSFTLQPDSQSFLSLRPTTQTIYWAIFAITILLLGLWVLKLHLAVEELYNSIDANHAAFEVASHQLRDLLSANR